MLNLGWMIQGIEWPSEDGNPVDFGDFNEGTEDKFLFESDSPYGDSTFMMFPPFFS